MKDMSLVENMDLQQRMEYLAQRGVENNEAELKMMVK